jgi:mono/diheme cytochrome c family protein
MKIVALVLLGASLTVSALVLAAMDRSPARPSVPDPVARGKYLVNLGCCHDCHTPKRLGPAGPEDDPERLLAGHPENLRLPLPPDLRDNPWFATTAGLTAWFGPWGISYAANLTPDRLTGMGIWTEDMFVRALRQGKHMGHGRDLLPPMPWQYFSKLTDEDLKAIFAYLRSIPPVRNRVPDPVPANGPASYE